MSRMPRLCRSPLRALVAFAAAAVLTLPAMLGPQAPAFAEHRVGGGAAVAASDDVAEPPLLVVSPPSPVLGPGQDTYEFSVLLRNPTDEPLPEGELRLSLGLSTTDPALADTVTSESDESISTEPVLLATQPIVATEPNAEQVVAVTVPDENMPDIDGIYHLTAKFEAEQPLLGPPSGIDSGTDDLTGDSADSNSAANGTNTGTADSSSDSAADTDEIANDAPSAELDSVVITASTLMVWGEMTAPIRVPLTLVVPLVLPAGIEGMPNRAQVVAVTPMLTEVLSLAERQNATLAVDPRIIAAVRALGTDAPTESQELVTRLEHTLSPLFMLQFADADPAAQAALGFDELLQPIGLNYITRFGSFDSADDSSNDSGGAASGDEASGSLPGEPGALGGSDTAAPDAREPGAEVEAGTGDDSTPNANGTDDTTTDGTNSTNRTGTDTGTGANTDTADTGNETGDDPRGNVPTLTQLTTLENSRSTAWPAEAQVDSATLGLLASSAIDSLVLSSANVSHATGTRVTIGAFEALVADEALASFAAAALGGSTPTERAAGLSNLAATIASSAHQSSTGAVLALGRGALADLLARDNGLAELTDFFATLESLSWAQIVAERVQPEGVATLRAGATSETRRELLRATLRRSSQIDELGALLVQPEYMSEFQRVRLLEAFATRYAAPETDFVEVDATIQQRDEELLVGVQPITNESTQLVGTSSRVPITLRNALPFDARVSLHAVPTSPAISLPERDFEASVPATGNSAVLVPVHSRVSSGESAMLLDVRALSGDRSFASGVQRLTLRTSVETTIMWTLGGLVGLLLSFGVWRSYRRRRSTQLVTSTNQRPAETE